MYTIFWLTGLPCAGKTTIAKELARHIHAEILDGDEIRKIISNDDFSIEGRRKHMLSVAAFASVLSKYNNVIVAMVSPIKGIREEIQKQYPNVREVYVYADIETCKKRDVKGMYARALSGKITNFTGVDAAYEAPGKKTLMVDTTMLSVGESVSKILNKHYQYNKYSLFIGRWQPLHKGHLALFETVRAQRKNILIGIRNTGLDDKNPFTIAERIEIIRKKVPDARVMVVPDIEAICYGRDVGYEVTEIVLSKELTEISGTQLRQKLKESKHAHA